MLGRQIVPAKVPAGSGCWWLDNLAVAGIMAAKKRRKGPRHRGVVLIKPDEARRIGWRARYVDPDSGRVVKISLDPALTTNELREDWAVRKSRQIAQRRLELDAGDARLVRKPIGEAVEEYFKEAVHRLRDGTLELYRAATALFTSWAKAANIATTAEITAVKLPGLRDYLLARRKQDLAVGGKRGSRKSTEKKLSPQTINWQLRSIKTVLNHMRLRGVVPLSRDAIADALRPVPVPREAPEFLSPTDCTRLIEAALRHDAETFVATREEHAGLRPAGSTRRYEPIAPFVSCALLSGMRFGEVLALKWSDVDLDARDQDGRVVGEIRLRAADTKTKHARTVGLEVSPVLRSMLAVMRLRKGDATYVFGGDTAMSRTLAEASRRRLIASYGAPEFSWQTLRRSCGTYLTNAPGIFGAASAYRSAKQLGHGVEVAEKHYAGLFRGISREARTLEAAMGLEGVMSRLLHAADRRSAPRTLGVAAG